MDKILKACLLPAVSALLLSSCGDNGCIRLTEQVPVLQKAYPLGYPSTAPLPNRQMGVLSAGNHVYTAIVDGKDFRAYAVQLENGRTGYVIHDVNVKACQE